MLKAQEMGGNEEDQDCFEANKAMFQVLQQQYLAHPSSELSGKIQQLYEKFFNLFQYYGYDPASCLDSSCALTEEANNVSSESYEQQYILMMGESSRFSEPKPNEIGGTDDLNRQVEDVTLGDLMGDDYGFSADELDNLKSRIPSPKEKEVYKQPKFFQKRSYHCRRISGTTDATGDPHEVVRIPIFSRMKAEEINRDYHNAKYVHFGLVQIKMVGQFRAGIDAPILSIVQDERMNWNPIDAIIGGVQSNLAGRIVAFNLRPNFYISITDKYIDYALRLRIELKGVTCTSGRKPLAIFWESLLALSNLATFPVEKKFEKGIVEVIRFVPSQPITTGLHSVKDLKIDPRWQMLLQETWTRPETWRRPQVPELEFQASGKHLIIRNRPQLTASPKDSTSQQRDASETSSQPGEVQEQRIVRCPIPSQEEDNSTHSFHVKTTKVERMGLKKIMYNYLYVSVEIRLLEYQNYTLHALFDTGATISVIRPEAIPREYWLAMKRKKHINGVQGNFELTHRVTNFPLWINDINGQAHRIVIKEMFIFPRMNGDIVIGNNVLQHYFPIKIDKSNVSITTESGKIKVPRLQRHKHMCDNPHFKLKQKASQASMEIFADHLDKNHISREKRSSTSELLITEVRNRNIKILLLTSCNISLTFFLKCFHTFVAKTIIPVCSYFWCRKFHRH